MQAFGRIEECLKSQSIMTVILRKYETSSPISHYLSHLKQRELCGIRGSLGYREGPLSTVFLMHPNLCPRAFHPLPFPSSLRSQVLLHTVAMRAGARQNELSGLC